MRELAGLGIESRRHVDGEHRRVGVVQRLGDAGLGVTQGAANSGAEHRVHGQVGRRQVVGDGVDVVDRTGVVLGGLECAPVLACDFAPDGLGPTEQADPDVVVVEKSRGDEGVPAVVPPAGDHEHRRAGVEERSHLASDGVAARFHQLLARDAERLGVGVDDRHLRAGNHARGLCPRGYNPGSGP